MLSDAFVSCIHDVPNAFPFSKRLGLRSVPSFDLSSSCLVAGALLAMLVLSCSLFCSACHRRSFMACGLCEFI